MSDWFPLRGITRIYNRERGWVICLLMLPTICVKSCILFNPSLGCCLWLVEQCMRGIVWEESAKSFLIDAKYVKPFTSLHSKVRKHGKCRACIGYVQKTWKHGLNCWSQGGKFCWSVDYVRVYRWSFAKILVIASINRGCCLVYDAVSVGRVVCSYYWCNCDRVHPFLWLCGFCWSF